MGSTVSQMSPGCMRPSAVCADSHWAIMLSCVSCTPLGIPVVPDVNIIVATSSFDTRSIPASMSSQSSLVICEPSDSRVE